MIKDFVRSLVIGGAVALALNAAAADLTVKPGEQAPPGQVTEPIRNALSAKPVQLLEEGKPALQIWFRKEVPLKAKPSSAGASLEAIPETTLLAVVSVEGSGFKDYKDNDIPKGVFTARFALQPQDGDHLGTAEFNTFVVLIATDTDKALDTFTRFTPMVKASGKLTSTGHPVVVSLRPVTSSDGNFPALSEPVSDQKAIRVKLPGKTSDGETADLLFDFVYQGHGHIQ